MNSEHLFIQSGPRFYRVRISSLLYLYRKGTKTLVVTEEGSLVTTSDLTEWQHFFPKGFFFRLRHDCLIVVDRIEEWQDSKLIIGGNEMKITGSSRRHLKKELASRFLRRNRAGINSLWKVNREGRLENTKE